MNGKPDGARLAGNGAGHALADPPEGISGELIAPGWIEFLHSTLKTEGALLNQVKQLQALALIFLGNADHQTEVGLHHALFGAATDPQKTAYEIASCLVGSEMCIRDRFRTANRNISDLRKI